MLLKRVVKMCSFAFVIAIAMAARVLGQEEEQAAAAWQPTTMVTLAAATTAAAPAAAATQTTQTATTTTTIASSNAPATITSDAVALGDGGEDVDVAASATTTVYTQQANAFDSTLATLVTAKTLLSAAPSVAANVPTTEAAREQLPAVSKSRTEEAYEQQQKQQEQEQQEQEQPLKEQQKEQQGKKNGGNKAGKTQIKNVKPATPQTSAQADPTTQQQQERSATTVAATFGAVAWQPQEAEILSKEMEMQSGEKAALKALVGATVATRTTTTTPVKIIPTAAKATLHNEPHVAADEQQPQEEQQQPDLYRIKLAEIVPDEFNGLPATTKTATAEVTTATTTGATQSTASESDEQIDEKVDKQTDEQIDERVHKQTDNQNAAAQPETASSHNKLDTVTAEQQRYELYPPGSEREHLQQQLHSASDLSAGHGVNIVDLYPMKMEDFKPIIRDSNDKLLKERTIYAADGEQLTRADDAVPDLETEKHQRQQLQNLLPNEVDVEQQQQQPEHGPAYGATYPQRHMVNHAPASISDFTGKVLAEQDGVITEIEQKFQLSEYAATVAAVGDSTTTTTAATKVSTPPPLSSYSVNHKLLAGVTADRGASGSSGGVYDFIDRRVKKSYDFPLHHTAASDVSSMPRIDFANTKFNGDKSGPPPNGNAPVSGLDIFRAHVAAHLASMGAPAYSTTKFYNSKELYNEMWLHNKPSQQQLLSPADIGSRADGSQLNAPQAATNTVQPYASTSSSSSSGVAESTASSAAVATTVKAKKYQKELKRAKLLLKAVLPVNKAATATTDSSTTLPQANTAALVAESSATTTTTTTSTASSSSSATRSTTVDATTPVAAAGGHTVAASPTTVTVTATVTSTPPVAAATTAAAPPVIVTAHSDGTLTSTSSLYNRQRVTNPTKSTSKPIARPRILTRLQEKINSLECEIQNVPPDSHLWRGNETHELLLPIMSATSCHNEHGCTGVDTATSASFISWQGEAEIQSGDILIVEINDALLNQHFPNASNSAHNTQVYQVTRSGHEHCDVTEGILLDITPLVVDGRKLVTLYDKDLTEGVNLLIVVSELWGSQCVRLKVTTKTDNCGENADCSGKGVCFSNVAMEEYECQCCSGFAGPHCEEIDACTPSPCTNNGICVDLSQGHEGNSYQCLCPYGYTGKNCQYESDPCNSAECMNGGSCVGNSTHFRCDCTPGFTGPLCQHSLNECESSPCVHGICVDQEDGFRCFCQPGFAGELCNFEYNECESNPCQNGGECIDHIGSYECRCSKGYTGKRCQIKVDFCANKPCPEGHRCIDHGNDYSCECPGGHNGLDCNQMPRTQCNVNPCTHGGTCWSSGESFYCACRPGYTGTMCEDEFVVETVVSSSEFMVDDTSARNFNDKTFGSSVVLKSPIELHNAYFAAGVLAAAIFIVAIVVTICHCKVNQTYRKFSTRSTTFFPILGFGRRPKSQGKLNKHWLSGKGLGSSGNPLRSSSSTASLSRGQHQHLPASSGSLRGAPAAAAGNSALQHGQQQGGGPLYERPFQRHLAMNLENDMYYTVDFSENSQHSPLIQ